MEYQNCFNGEVVQKFLTRVFSTVAFDTFLRSETSEGNLIKFLSKNVRGNAVQMFPIFPPKVLVFKRELFPSTDFQLISYLSPNKMKTVSGGFYCVYYFK